MGLNECRVQALLAVSDLDRAKRFYEHQLGLVSGEEEEEAGRYPCADGAEIGIYLSLENAGKSPATLAGWFVDDLERIMCPTSARRSARLDDQEAVAVGIADEELRRNRILDGHGSRDEP